jgi:1,4-dihydroxy-2-naphthoate octaprenyltransferase
MPAHYDHWHFVPYFVPCYDIHLLSRGFNEVMTNNITVDSASTDDLDKSSAIKSLSPKQKQQLTALVLSLMGVLLHGIQPRNETM